MIVFQVHKDGKTTAFTKRIIGLPGDKIQLHDGLISINNTLLRQDATGNDDGNHHGFVEILPEGKKVSIFRDNSPIDNVDAAYDVPAGQYFVVGDNRGNSEDSRNMLGYIQLGDIIGKVTVVLWNDQSYKISYRPVE